ncbi:MAG: hypothetical protein U0169_26490 [Polyangiaceae bacterium]
MTRPRSRGRGRGATAVVVFVAAVVATFAPAAACVIVDPPAELPPVVARRPTIRHSEVAPPASRVLRGFPLEFVVPVEVGDPGDDFVWNVFVDYNVGGSGFVDSTGESKGDRADPDAGVRLVEFQLNPRETPTSDFRACHVVEFLVARQFSPSSPRVFGAPGGDSVTWFINPSGSFVGCPEYDGGTFAIEDAGADGAADAGADGTGGT